MRYFFSHNFDFILQLAVQLFLKWSWTGISSFGKFASEPWGIGTQASAAADFGKFKGLNILPLMKLSDQGEIYQNHRMKSLLMPTSFGGSRKYLKSAI